MLGPQRACWPSLTGSIVKAACSPYVQGEAFCHEEEGKRERRGGQLGFGGKELGDLLGMPVERDSTRECSHLIPLRTSLIPSLLSLSVCLCTLLQRSCNSGNALTSDSYLQICVLVEKKKLFL